ncbi:MAG: hypothetical protein HYT10_01760 [Candidatus Levybacteria bacterium]|nr:hypothetical protein [Candidatus Levybacteria bacterium]
MKQILPIIFVIAFGVVMRLLPHPANVAPVAALALFGGVYLEKKYAVILPIVIMFVSDAIIGFHNTMVFVYASFILIGLIGLWLRSHKTLTSVISASLFSSLIFFLVTNFGVWLVGNMYQRSLNGLVTAFVLALPFFRNTIMGDLLYTGLFFAVYEFIKVVILSNAKHSIKVRKDSSPAKAGSE